MLPIPVLKQTKPKSKRQISQ